MRSGSRTWMWLLVVGLFFTQAVPRLAAQKHDEGQPTFTVFDPPGSISTEPASINPAGVITGRYSDANHVEHGFLRAPDGAITTFDAPGAGTGLGQGTYAAAINPAGVITGTYGEGSDAINIVFHGFLRGRDGTFTTFDVPGAGTGPAQGTYAAAINPAAVITGSYSDAGEPGGTSIAYHGFLRAPDGTITTFDAPNANGAYGSTGASAINPAGLITGSYSDANDVFYGFLRAPDGTITSFDAPGAGSDFAQGTYAEAINPAGVITGYYINANLRFHGFLRAQDGGFTTFDVPGGTATIPVSINPAGAITGYYYDDAYVTHGFVRYEESRAGSR